jgi:hypothetical protein
MTFACSAYFEPAHFFEDIGTDVILKVSITTLLNFKLLSFLDLTFISVNV